MTTTLPTKFVEEPVALLCPVCKKIFREPVISVKCGHTFCKLCINQLISQGQKCPIDDQVCDSSQLVLNRAVNNQIDDLLIHCRHGLISPDGGKTWREDPSGCQEVVSLGKRLEHEAVCQFAKVLCPVGGQLCGSLRSHQLERHMPACTQVPCPYTDFGCFFRGVATEVAEHKKDCSYRDESQLLAITMREIKAVKASNEELKQALAKAVKAVEKLSNERTTMCLQLEQQALTITSLTSRMDRLQTEFEAFKTVRLRQASKSALERGGGGEGTPRYPRRTSHNDTKRWSTDSTASLASTSHELGYSLKRPFLWQMPFTIKCIGTFRGHKGTIWSMEAYGDRLYSGSGDGSIKVWDVADLRRGCLKTVAAHRDCVMSLAVGRGVLYSAGTDLTLRSWQLNTMEEVGSVQKIHDGMVSAMVCSKEYVFTSSLGCIKVWDLITLNPVHTIDNISQSWVRALVYDKRKDRLYSCSFNKLHIWRGSDNFGLVHELETQFGAIYSIAITQSYVITGTHNQNIQVYDVASLKHVCSLTGHIGIVTVLRVTESPHGQFMFSASSDTTVQVWNLENMLPILALQRHEKAVQSMAFCQDSVYTGSEDMEIKVFRNFKL